MDQRGIKEATLVTLDARMDLPRAPRCSTEPFSRPFKVHFGTIFKLLGHFCHGVGIKIAGETGKRKQ